MPLQLTFIGKVGIESVTDGYYGNQIFKNTMGFSGVKILLYYFLMLSLCLLHIMQILLEISTFFLIQTRSRCSCFHTSYGIVFTGKYRKRHLPVSFIKLTGFFSGRGALQRLKRKYGFPHRECVGKCRNS